MLGRSLDELPPGTRRLLDAVHGYVTARCEAEGLDRDLVRFTRRQLRESLSFGDTQLKVHLARLADFELVIAHRTAAGGFCYELAWQPSADATGLDAAAAPDRSGPAGGRSGPGRLPVGGRPAPGRAALNDLKSLVNGHHGLAEASDDAERADPGRDNHRVIAAAGGAR